MGGSATLGDNLVDSLLGMVDDLRGSLNPSMGVRQFRVFLEKVTWSGASRGDGTPTLVSTEILPQPLVTIPTREFGLHYVPAPAGRLDQGLIIVSEISLTYTSDELTGGTLDEKTEFRYRVSDAQGQGIPDGYFVPEAPPAPDREKTIGWIVRLNSVEPLG